MKTSADLQDVLHERFSDGPWERRGMDNQDETDYEVGLDGLGLKKAHLRNWIIGLKF